MFNFRMLSQSEKDLPAPGTEELKMALANGTIAESELTCDL